jgi:radical SAM superfamily enzyme YgiQ (UPF0313 family)
MSEYEIIPVTHRECGGQGCRFCDAGEIQVRTEVTA